MSREILSGRGLVLEPDSGLLARLCVREPRRLQVDCQANALRLPHHREHHVTQLTHRYFHVSGFVAPNGCAGVLV